jgi:WNK lysine deficient protein kinase
MRSAHPQHDDDPNEQIVERSPDGRYSRFNQQLGHGAFKAVFKGYDEEEGIEVAWCQVNMERVGEAEKMQIHTEVDILKSLTHKHILTFFAYFDLPSTKQIVFITEIMTSGTLKQYIHKAKRVKRKVVKKWCRQILDGCRSCTRSASSTAISSATTSSSTATTRRLKSAISASRH